MTAPADFLFHPPATIDLNCDLGESEDADQIAADEALLDTVTSANIACMGHAGSQESMARTIRAAMIRGVAIGAHPSFPDRSHFGRVEVEMSAAAIEQNVAHQIGQLVDIASTLGARVSHVKPHGALYHAAMSKPVIAEALARALVSIDPSLAIIGFAGTPAIEQWGGMGLRVIDEAFADRRYEPDGSLTPRARPGSLIENVHDAAVQAVVVARDRAVIVAGGKRVPVHARTICLHSDTPNAPARAVAVRAALEHAGVLVRPF